MTAESKLLLAYSTQLPEANESRSASPGPAPNAHSMEAPGQSAPSLLQSRGELW